MATKPLSIPSFRLHKSTGRAVVSIDGKDRYLGQHNDPESRVRYDRMIAEWLSRGRGEAAAPEKLQDITVATVIEAYWNFAQGYYVKNGKHTSEIYSIKAACRHLNHLYGSQAVTEFSPLKLAAVREAMIAAGWGRKPINGHVDRIKRIFKWGVAQELVPAAVSHGINCLAGLHKGRTSAKESEPVRPVPQPMVDATLPFLPRQLVAVVELQLLTGARPGEICIMRAGDIDRTGPVWIYRPGDHKTAHHGKGRELYLGPKAQEILRPWLRLDGKPLFQPVEAIEERLAARRTLGPRKHKSDLKWKPGDAYDVAAYRRAITRACERAFPPPADLGPRPIVPTGRKKKQRMETPKEWRARLVMEKQWAKVVAWRHEHSWHPHQLRHSRATDLRARYGIEAARLILGHSDAGVTEIYAERDAAQARRIMQEVG